MTDLQIREAKDERNRYQREWRAKNKDKVRAINARYWAKRARQRKESEDHNEQKTAN